MCSQKGQQQAQLGVNRGLGGGPQGHWGPADGGDGEGGKVEEIVASLCIELSSWSFLLTDQEKETGKSK